MTKRNNYSDNLFYLNDIIKNLKTGVSLDIDGDIFFDKITQDIFFIDTALDTIFNTIQETPHILKRIENLRFIKRSKTMFTELLEEITDEKLPFSYNIQPIFNEIKNIIQKHRHIILEIQSILEESSESNGSEELVSQEEFNLLLKEEEEENT